MTLHTKRTWLLLAGLTGILLNQFMAPEAVALPDLILWGGSINPSIITTNFTGDDCSVNEGCSGGGARRLLRFNTESRNIGNSALVLGDPTNNPLFEYDPCHGHYHLSGFAAYRLVDSCGIAAVSAKRAFCLADYYRFDPAANPTQVYSCANQGLQPGWADIYNFSTPCQWIDITGLLPGQYSLQVEINPDHVFAESDYANNLTNVTITIPLLDNNSNGMGDDWESLYGVSNPAADPDGDGMSNLQEYLTHTNPTNSASALHITAVAREGDNLRVTWLNQACRTNILERSTGNLGGGYSNNFVTIYTVTNVTSAVTNYLDFGAATNTPARYYRVRLISP